jgi:ubiquinone/menaquinone biosynthesis C-methylase UbiE
VGFKTVIHPGGFGATKKLIKTLNITANSKVIDIACGKGTTAILLAEDYGCNVVAIDIDDVLIEEAKYLTRKRGLQNKITYHTGNAMQLPFSDNEFDAAISQAMLVLVDDKIKAIQEAERVIKKGGVAGWLELSWKKEITQEFIDKVSRVICACCMTNVSTFDGWRRIFKDAGIEHVNTVPLDFSPDSGSFIGMIKDEGFIRSLSIIMNIMKNRDIRGRMKTMRTFFRDYEDVFGCCIYWLEK